MIALPPIEAGGVKLTVACAFPAVAVPMVGAPGVVTDVGACVTVTSTGLPVAPVDVTRMVAVLAEMLVFASKPQLMVPELAPLAPDVIRSQLLAGVTAAVHGMVPVPVLETLNVVAPASLATARLAGLTEMTEESNGPDCPPRTART